MLINTDILSNALQNNVAVKIVTPWAVLELDFQKIKQEYAL